MSCSAPGDTTDSAPLAFAQALASALPLPICHRRAGTRGTEVGMQVASCGRQELRHAVIQLPSSWEAVKTTCSKAAAAESMYDVATTVLKPDLQTQHVAHL